VASELDRTIEAVMAAVTGPEGRIQAGRDADGRVIVTNLPPTLPLLFDVFCTIYGQSEALVCHDERLTFAELHTHTVGAAKALAARGIGKGDRVAIAMRNASGWITSYFAVLKAGGVAVLVNGWWEHEELKQALQLSEPKLILADAARAKRIGETGLAIPVITLPIEKSLAEALAPLLEGAGEVELPDVTPEDDATILFTSGSTGRAKGAVSTHRAVTTGAYTYAAGLATLLAIKEQRGQATGNQPRTLVAVPFFHVTGEVPVLLTSFVIGRGMVLMPRWDAGEALRLIEKEKITYFVGVPTMGLEMMQHPDREKYDLSTLTDLAAGGAPRPVSHVARLQQSFPTAQPALGYGLTETNAVGCSNFWSNYADKPASTGRAQQPFVEVDILGADDQPLPAGERGEIAIRSADNIRGYWRDPQATAAALTADGHVRTGDIGYLDADGYLFIVDRKKDIIIRGGENISSQEVEAALYSHPGVSEAAVFSLPSDRLGEEPAAVIYSQDGISAEQLHSFLEGKLAKFKLPARVWFSEEPLPKLGTGKIDRVTLRDSYRAKVAAGG
jgi:acyl-CoA synthetase (AMP-forming)/AMP-acid ligase II